jgi:hypothetical protein
MEGNNGKRTSPQDESIRNNSTVENSKENKYLPHIYNRKECINMFVKTYCYDEVLKEDAREEGFEMGIELAPLIYKALLQKISIPTIAKEHGITVRQVEQVKEAFAI